jgi:hypothetical protein
MATGGVYLFFDGFKFLPIDLSRTVPTNYVVKELGARTDLSSCNRNAIFDNIILLQY